MRLLQIAAVAPALFLSVASHATVWYVNVNGKEYGRHVGIRRPLPAAGVSYNNSPEKDLMGPNIACNRGGDREAPQWLDANAGDSLTFVWRHDKELNQGDDIIPSSHKGPILVHITDKITNINGQGVWTKIYEDGNRNGGWAVDKLIRAQGRVTIKIPSSLKPGKYLFRNDIIALHEANVAYNQNRSRGAQLYPNCVQINIVNGGNTSPPGGVSFPGTITYSTPGIIFDSWAVPMRQYPVPAPGGTVWSG